MITERQIDEVLDNISESENPTEYLTEIQNNQAHVHQWLHSDSFDILMPNEKEGLLFLAILIHQAFQTFKEISESISTALIESKEDENWEVFSTTKGKFRNKVDPFFKNYPQEDLLAYVEDFVQNDEEEDISPVARQVLFISAKTMIDLYHKASS